MFDRDRCLWRAAAAFLPTTEVCAVAPCRRWAELCRESAFPALLACSGDAEGGHCMRAEPHGCCAAAPPARLAGPHTEALSLALGDAAPLLAQCGGSLRSLRLGKGAPSPQEWPRLPLLRALTLSALPIDAGPVLEAVLATSPALQRLELLNQSGTPVEALPPTLSPALRELRLVRSHALLPLELFDAVASLRAVHASAGLDAATLHRAAWAPRARSLSGARLGPGPEGDVALPALRDLLVASAARGGLERLRAPRLRALQLGSDVLVDDEELVRLLARSRGSLERLELAATLYLRDEMLGALDAARVTRLWAPSRRSHVTPAALCGFVARAGRLRQLALPLQGLSVAQGAALVRALPASLESLRLYRVPGPCTWLGPLARLPRLRSLRIDADAFFTALLAEVARTPLPRLETLYVRPDATARRSVRPPAEAVDQLLAALPRSLRALHLPLRSAALDELPQQLLRFSRAHVHCDHNPVREKPRHARTLRRELEARVQPTRWPVAKAVMLTAAPPAELRRLLQADNDGGSVLHVLLGQRLRLWLCPATGANLAAVDLLLDDRSPVLLHPCGDGALLRQWVALVRAARPGRRLYIVGGPLPAAVDNCEAMDDFFDGGWAGLADPPVARNVPRALARLAGAVDLVEGNVENAPTEEFLARVQRLVDCSRAQACRFVEALCGVGALFTLGGAGVSVAIRELGSGRLGLAAYARIQEFVGERPLAASVSFRPANLVRELGHALEAASFSGAGAFGAAPAAFGSPAATPAAALRAGLGSPATGFGPPVAAFAPPTSGFGRFGKTAFGAPAPAPPPAFTFGAPAPAPAPPAAFAPPAPPPAFTFGAAATAGPAFAFGAAPAPAAAPAAAPAPCSPAHAASAPLPIPAADAHPVPQLVGDKLVDAGLAAAHPTPGLYWLPHTFAARGARDSWTLPPAWRCARAWRITRAAPWLAPRLLCVALRQRSAAVAVDSASVVARDGALLLLDASSSSAAVPRPLRPGQWDVSLLLCVVADAGSPAGSEWVAGVDVELGALWGRWKGLCVEEVDVGEADALIVS